MDGKATLRELDVMNDQVLNISTLIAEIDWLARYIEHVFHVYFMQEVEAGKIWDIEAPNLSKNDSAYANLISRFNLDKDERLVFAIVLAQELKPQVLDVFLFKNALIDRSYTEFGGAFIGNRFTATFQTLRFVLAANDVVKLSRVIEIASNKGLLLREGILEVKQPENEDSIWNSTVRISKSWLHHLISGEAYKRVLNSEFPAQEISTRLDWSDLVLEDHVFDQVMEIKTWLDHGETLMNEWDLKKKIKPGYRCLFYGPPGTGKTLTASLLGKSSGKPVYRIDISSLVSKYIGETEKNLAKVFDIAESQDWILFFDEADALFGKRSQGSSANDRFANQGTAYLLQKIEDYPGVIVIATNIKGNIDEAFARRFQSTIYFPMPQREEREKLWRNAFSGKCQLGSDIDIQKVSEDYEMAGGSIINVLRFCAMKTISRNETNTTQQELFEGLSRELAKENKTMTI